MSGAPLPWYDGLADSYRPGDLIKLRLGRTDPDERTQALTLTGPGPDGTTVERDETTIYRDPATWDAEWVSGHGPMVIIKADGEGWVLTTSVLEASDTLVVSVTDAQGHAVPMRIPINVRPDMRVGVDCRPEDRASHLGPRGLYPAASFTRVFCAGRLTPRSTGPEFRGVPAGVEPWPSMKIVDEASIEAYLAEPWPFPWPRKITVHHEPQDDMTADRFRPMVRQALDIAGDRAEIWVTLMGYWQEEHAATSKVEDWLVPGIAGLSWDVYDRHWVKGVLPPEQLFRLALDTAAAHPELQWGITEWGVAEWDVRGQALADHITRGVRVLDAAGCRYAAWWCTLGEKLKDGRTPNFHLDNDRLSLAAWQAACAA